MSKINHREGIWRSCSICV